ncbi:MAG: aspartyl protease family protein [Bacteroidetes bacterium]|nr:aspartyl protease family protein [Bacteroidota bacterium]
MFDFSYFKAFRKIFRFFSTLLFFILSITANAQEEFIPSPSKLISSFPFTTFTGGVIIIRAQLGDHPDSLNFILDTGSGGISLDSLTCVKLKIQPQASDKTIRGIAGIRQVKFVYNETLRIGGIKVDSLDFHVSDYDILSSVYGDRIDGIIGYSFFSRYIVKIDYDSNKIYVYTRGYMKFPRGGFLFRPVLINLPTQVARIRDDKAINARFYFDTGAGLCLLLSSDFVSDSSILSSNKKPVPTQAQGLGGKTDMLLTTIKELKIGPYKFRNVPTFIFDDEYNVTSYPYLGGLLGNDILRRFNVYLNYERRDFYLIPNSHYRDPFDYSYTGLGLYWIDGQILVGDVMKGSPAEKAGFKVDDVIVALNNNFSLNLQAYKSMLQNIGDRIRVIVKRREGLTELSLKIRSIF